MLRDRVQALMREVGPLADLHAVGEFEGEDVWSLLVDDDTVVDVDLDAERGCLVLSAEIGPLLHADRERWLELLLQYGCQWARTGGARMAVATQGGPILLLADHAIADLAAGELARRLGSFAGLVHTWREILAQGASGAAPGDTAAMMGSGMPGGMIRA